VTNVSVPTLLIKASTADATLPTVLIKAPIQRENGGTKEMPGCIHTPYYIR
jgi:hypothetical protein